MVWVPVPFLLSGRVRLIGVTRHDFRIGCKVMIRGTLRYEEKLEWSSGITVPHQFKPWDVVYVVLQQEFYALRTRNEQVHLSI